MFTTFPKIVRGHSAKYRKYIFKNSSLIGLRLGPLLSDPAFQRSSRKQSLSFVTSLWWRIIDTMEMSVCTKHKTNRLLAAAPSISIVVAARKHRASSEQTIKNINCIRS